MAILFTNHGAGSRPGAQFWDEEKSRALYQENKRIRDLSAQLLFKHHEPYLAWLRGENRPHFVFILGMHRSGTSCLAGAMERCGVFLGEVNRANKYNVRGNHELRQVVQLHRDILAANGGSWSSPPAEIAISDEQRQAIRQITAELKQNINAKDNSEPIGLKNPDTLLLLDPWLEESDNYALIWHLSPSGCRRPIASAPERDVGRASV